MPLPPYRPEPGSPSEREAYLALQPRLRTMFEDVYPNPQAPRGVVVLPGLSLDRETLRKLTGAQHYEERQLSMLTWLRLPRTQVIFMSSTHIPDALVDYYLGMLPGVPHIHARARLTMLTCNDASEENLTRKILARPRLVQRIRDAIVDPNVTHMTAFNTTPDEVTLAVQLGIPLYGNDPALDHLGTKSGSRKIFREAGVELPDGVEDLHGVEDAARAVSDLRRRNPALRRAVLKLEEGFSGEGNAILDLPRDAENDPASMRERILRTLRPEAPGQSAEEFLAVFARMGGIAEAWVEGEGKNSPSVQMRVTPSRTLEIISTHDQMLGGASGQVFLGSTFPANDAYRGQLVDAARKVGKVLLARGVQGRFAVDFVTVRDGASHRAYAIEINLRKGGTTLPFQMLQFLTAGTVDAQTGEFLTPLGEVRAYYATDNLQKDAYRALTSEDLIDILVRHQLQFDATRQQGVVFHLMGALSMYGKLGLVSIAPTIEAAEAQYKRVEALLDEEAAHVPLK
jgi:hypothetical protein